MNENTNANSSGKKSDSFFFPISVDLSERKVLVVGGGQQAYLETVKLLEFGATVDVMASHMVAEFTELQETHGNRISLFRQSFTEESRRVLHGDSKVGRYVLIYALSYSDQENRAAIQMSDQEGCLVYSCDHLTISNFVPPTTIKRGHFKLSVSTDGLAPMLEQALIQRLEATLLTDVDKYVLFLSSLQEKIEHLRANSEPASANKAARELASMEELLFALKRLNFNEAIRLIDEVIEGHVSVKTSTTNAAVKEGNSK